MRCIRDGLTGVILYVHQKKETRMTVTSPLRGKKWEILSVTFGELVVSSPLRGGWHGGVTGDRRLRSCLGAENGASSLRYDSSPDFIAHIAGSEGKIPCGGEKESGGCVMNKVLRTILGWHLR